MKIGNILDRLGNIPYVTVSEQSTLHEAFETIARAIQFRCVYVVDHEDRLRGILSAGDLIRHLMTTRHDPRFHARSLLTRITSRQVSDIMDRYVVTARLEDDPAEVLDRMLDNHIKQIPVLGDDGRIIANVGVIDLWKAVEKSDPP